MIPAEVQEMLMPHQVASQPNTVLQETPVAAQAIDDENENKIEWSARISNTAMESIYSLAPLADRLGGLVSVTFGPPEPQWNDMEQKEVENQVAQMLLEKQASELSETQVREALAAAQKFKRGTLWRIAKATLLLRLTELGYTQEALDIARTIWGEMIPAEVLVMLMPYLTQLQQTIVLRELLDTTHAVNAVNEKAWVLAMLVPHLAAQQKDAVLQEALASALYQLAFRVI
jgi:hypothetical protein